MGGAELSQPKAEQAHSDLEVNVRRALGQLDLHCSAHGRSIGSDRSVGVEADAPVVAASVFKVAVALEFCRQVSARELDPLEEVRTTVAERTPGPTGLSTFSDDAAVSLRDLAASMMAVSDNAATDILLERVTIDRINKTLKSLGATSTHIAYSVRSLLSTVAAEAGLATWDDVLREDPYYDRLQQSSVLSSEATTRTTARDMTTLLSAIWTDRAGPPDACARVRYLMSLQGSNRLGKRLPNARVFAKSGSLLGVIRNEVGVAEFDDSERYAMAVFTRRPRTDFGAGPAIDDAMGEVARLLVDQLRVELSSTHSKEGSS